VFEEIEERCSKHEYLLRVGNIAVSARIITQAWRLIPEPKREWCGALWVAAAMGNAPFARG
jgi:hypothetical protein